MLEKLYSYKISRNSASVFEQMLLKNAVFLLYGYVKHKMMGLQMM